VDNIFGGAEAKMGSGTREEVELLHAYTMSILLTLVGVGAALGKILMFIWEATLERNFDIVRAGREAGS
jgi:hypothetical protein